MLASTEFTCLYILHMLAVANDTKNDIETLTGHVHGPVKCYNHTNFSICTLVRHVC